MRRVFILLVGLVIIAVTFYGCARELTNGTDTPLGEPIGDNGGGDNPGNTNGPSTTTQRSPLDLVITEINWGGSYSNSTNATADGEFIEIMNNTTDTINLGGFQLRYDGGGNFTNKRVTLPSTITLAPGEFLVVFITNSSHNPYSLVTNTNTYKTFLWTGINYIANNGFRIAIIDPNGNELDFVETRNGQPGRVPIKGSSGMPKKTMERILPFMIGTNADAWDEAVSNVNYAFGGANNLGTPGASNSVWFISKTITLTAPANSKIVNKAVDLTYDFRWSISGKGSLYTSYLLVFTISNQVFTNIPLVSTNATIGVLGFSTGSYEWFVLGIFERITNSSTNTNSLIVTNFASISLVSPSDNTVHNIAIDGNNISLRWSYDPFGALHVANVYLLDANNNPVRSNSLTLTNFSIDVSGLPLGDYRWYVVASNTNSGLVVYSTTNNVKITNYASVALLSPANNYTNNIAESGSTINFSWAYSPASAFNRADIYVLDSSDNIIASQRGLDTTSFSYSVSTYGVYKWYVVATNTSTGFYSYSSTNTFYITNFGYISLVVFPTNNHLHDLLSYGNNLTFSWIYTPTNAFDQATIYIGKNNTVVMSQTTTSTSATVDLSSLPSGRYNWFVVATNTIYGLSSYSPTNSISVYRLNNSISNGVFFSEIAWGGFRTSNQTSMHDGEFIELYNTNNYDINLRGWTISYVNSTYSPSSIKHWAIANDLIIRGNSVAVILSRSTNTNYIVLENIDDWYVGFEPVPGGGAIANSGFVLWLWNTSGNVTNISDHVIATVNKTNTFHISSLPPLFTTNGGFSPLGTPSSSNIASTMVRTNFIYDPTNGNRTWFTNSVASNLRGGVEIYTRATPGVLLY